MMCKFHSGVRVLLSPEFLRCSPVLADRNAFRIPLRYIYQLLCVKAIRDIRTNN